jgi:hypothetical protein
MTPGVGGSGAVLSDLYQRIPSGMPKHEQMTGFSRCQHGEALNG